MLFFILLLLVYSVTMIFSCICCFIFWHYYFLFFILFCSFFYQILNCCYQCHFLHSLFLHTFFHVIMIEAQVRVMIDHNNHLYLLLLVLHISYLLAIKISSFSDLVVGTLFNESFLALSFSSAIIIIEFVSLSNEI